MQMAPCYMNRVTGPTRTSYDEQQHMIHPESLHEEEVQLTKK